MADEDGAVLVGDEKLVAISVNLEVNLIFSLVTIFASCGIVVEPQGFETLCRNRTVTCRYGNHFRIGFIITDIQSIQVDGCVSRVV